MKSLMLFFREVLADAGTRCRVSTDSDLKTIAARVENEGLSFLTITLADFGKSFQKSLDLGSVSHDDFSGFHFNRGLPRFLGGFLDLVFDRGTGRLLDEPNVTAIQAIRQLTLMWAKIELPCTPERERAAVAKYIECEKDVREYDKLFPPLKGEFLRMSSLLFADLFTEIDRKVYYGELLPKHGDGSTAEGVLGNKKYYQHEWTDRLEEYFPAGEYLFPNWSFYDHDRLTHLEPGEERPVKVILVPKTLKTPRVIAKEPVCMQYVQQGLLEAITEYVDRDDFLSRLIGTRSQIPNQDMARVGSSNGTLATLDLSEASDRVSNQHVRTMLLRHPHLNGAVDASRSRKADVPGFGVVRLAKFASMGSALCFPFEAMVFLTVCFLGIQDVLNRQLTRKDVKSFLGQVRVYGDDIVVPVEFALSVVARLESFGFKVGRGKSFWTGKFRESCGKEYYDGRDVSIVKVRRVFPSQRTEAQEIISTVSLRNQLFKLGYFGSVEYLDKMIGKLIPFPLVDESSPVLGRVEFGNYQVDGFDRDLHSPFVKGMLVHSRLPVNPVDDYFALHKYFLKRGHLPVADRKHLERSGRASSVDIKAGRARPY